MCCSALIDEGWARGLLEQLEAGAACGTLFLAEVGARARRKVLAARGHVGCKGSVRRGHAGRRDENDEARLERLLADLFAHPAWEFEVAPVPMGAFTMRDLVDVALGYDAQHITARRAANE